MTIVAVVFGVTFLAVVSLPLLPGKHKGLAMVAAILANTAVSGYVAFNALTGHGTEILFDGNMVTGPIALRVDGLSAWFILTIDLVFLMGAFYGIQYLKNYGAQPTSLSLHYIAMVFLHTALLAVCSVQNSFVFLVAWEMMALSAFVTIIFEHHKITSIKAGINYLIQSHVSIVLLMMAFIWVAVKTGSFDFNAVRAFVEREHHMISVVLFLLFFTGFAIKAGFIPFHTWLPHAHPAAPAHISGILSGIVVKTGIYGILRMIMSIKSDYLALGVFILVVSVSGGIFAILNAALHRDIKRMLAYCTIENISIIGIGIGIGLVGIGTGSPMLYYWGFGGALLHLLNHALFKSMLFFSIGSVYQQTHARDMDQLGGLARSMPITTVFFLLGSVAVVGLPPLNGFMSEFIIYNGLIDGLSSSSIGLSIVMVLSFGGLAVIGGLSLLTFTKTFGVAFLGTPRREFAFRPKEVPWKMWWPQAFILTIMMLIAFIPQWFLMPAFKVAQSTIIPTLGFDTPDMDGTSHLLRHIGISGLLFGAIAGGILLVRKHAGNQSLVRQEATWGCGYPSPSSKIQYTGKSFSKTLGKVFGFMAIEIKHFDELDKTEIFPSRKKYVSHYLDFFEEKIIDPLLQRLLYVTNYFQFIQNGKVQWYLLYGILFIVMVFLLTYASELYKMFTPLKESLSP
ncbi:MAG: proton-conducting transporter membrane subunit [Breznakibacter sp.]